MTENRKICSSTNRYSLIISLSRLSQFPLNVQKQVEMSQLGVNKGFRVISLLQCMQKQIQVFCLQISNINRLTHVVVISIPFQQTSMSSKCIEKAVNRFGVTQGSDIKKGKQWVSLPEGRGNCCCLSEHSVFSLAEFRKEEVLHDRLPWKTKKLFL